MRYRLIASLTIATSLGLSLPALAGADENLIDHVRAIPTLSTVQAVAEDGGGKSQVALAHAFHEGVGSLPQDDAKALFWAREAAKQDAPGSAELMAMAYLFGWGDLDQDLAEMATWSHKAAAEGSANSMYNLSLMYGKGGGVEQDMQKMSYWLHKAAKGGNLDAQVALSDLYRTGGPVAPDLEKAVHWSSVAGVQGLPGELAFVAQQYSDRGSAPYDPHLAYLAALISYEMAKEQGVFEGATAEEKENLLRNLSNFAEKLAPLDRRLAEDLAADWELGEPLDWAKEM